MWTPSDFGCNINSLTVNFGSYIYNEQKMKCGVFSKFNAVAVLELLTDHNGGQQNYLTLHALSLRTPND